MGGGGGGGGAAARISEIFLYKEAGKYLFFSFFYKESKSNKNKSGGWEGRDEGVARVSDFFFQKNPSLNFFLGGGGGGEGEGGLSQ